ncbi:hypothetical protein [Couchioplanes azureus]|uniref:hypothetical protein n=1 Tax=Couchioplanes caeruleus TaxID=56438 RepID=UPI0016703502|nr:hypothetical protein [Couchioplanes caeruleus]GGQ77570.1 hypothetical protein GCM10010166_54400 [Couchioplanes caeruleus subsp. azureus]
MASNLFGPGARPERSAHDVKAAQDAAHAADAHRIRTGAAAGRDRRSIGKSGGR